MERGTTADPITGTAPDGGPNQQALSTTGDSTPGSSILTCRALSASTCPYIALRSSSARRSPAIRFFQQLDEALRGPQHVFSRTALHRAARCKARLLIRHIVDGAHHAHEPITLGTRNGHWGCSARPYSGNAIPDDTLSIDCIRIAARAPAIKIPKADKAIFAYRRKTFTPRSPPAARHCRRWRRC
jgi:hypothetical protein